jgi:hypothetical protein
MTLDNAGLTHEKDCFSSLAANVNYDLDVAQL